MSRPLGLLPAFVPTAASVDSPLSVGVRCAHKHRHSSGYAALPQGPSLRSGFCCPDPSSLIRPHPTHSQAQRDFAALQLIRPAFAVRCRLGHPRLVPCFHRSFFLNMSSSATPGSPAAVCTQFLHRQRWPSSLQYRLGSPILPANPFHAGGTFRSFTTVRLRYNLLICSPS